MVRLWHAFGSGKTTTLVARIGWLIDQGTPPGSICAITFNRRAAEELSARLESALGSGFSSEGGSVRVRTFHALGREILVDAGHAVEPLLDRMVIIRRVFPGGGWAAWRGPGDAFARLSAPP